MQRFSVLFHDIVRVLPDVTDLEAVKTYAYQPTLILKGVGDIIQERTGEMMIRKAEERDIPRIMELLGQVLQIHADIRPDIFIPSTTKYTVDELKELLKNKEKPIYIAANEADICVGYAFCQLQEQPFSNNMVQFTSLFIDDLCVDTTIRGKHIGQKLFEHVKKEAVRLGCYEVTLNVWEGNDSAKAFYEKMGLKPKETQMEYIIKDQGDRYGG